VRELIGFALRLDLVKGISSKASSETKKELPLFLTSDGPIYLLRVAARDIFLSSSGGERRTF
jgi:hypothetical protein